MTIKGKYKRSRGLYLGYIPYGFDSGSGAAIKIDPDPTNQWYHQVIPQIDTRVLHQEKKLECIFWVDIFPHGSGFLTMERSHRENQKSGFFNNS